MKPEFITSDVHLGVVPAETERAFLRFLEHVGSEGRRLIVPGDLFDFWFEYGDVIPGRHFRVLAALADLVDAGIEVLVTGGNHDAWGGSFLEHHVGVRYEAGQVRTEIAGRPALLAHGDALGKGDLGYRMLKAVIQSRPTVWAFRMLHPELGMRVAEWVSKTEPRPDTDPKKLNRARYIEEWALETFAREPELSYIVCGHTHLPAIQEVEPGRFYLNSGDWLDHRSYITVDSEGAPELRRWD